MSVQVEVVGIDKLLDLDEKLHESPKPLMAKIADQIADALREILNAGGFAPLSAATLEMRKRKGISGSEPLHATGAMARSLRARSTAAVAAAGFSFPAFPLQQGYTSGGAIAGKTVPARKFAYLTDERETAFMDQIEEFYFGAGT